jgi:hypothetical protein
MFLARWRDGYPPSMIDRDEYLDFVPVPLPKHGAPTSAFHH